MALYARPFVSSLRLSDGSCRCAEFCLRNLSRPSSTDTCFKIHRNVLLPASPAPVSRKVSLAFRKMPSAIRLTQDRRTLVCVSIFAAASVLLTWISFHTRCQSYTRERELKVYLHNPTYCFVRHNFHR
jgi:hypothetical protein